MIERSTYTNPLSDQRLSSAVTAGYLRSAGYCNLYTSGLFTSGRSYRS